MVFLLAILLLILLAIYATYRIAVHPMMTFNNGIPGPKPIPILGNILELGFNNESMFINGKRLVKEYGTLIRFWAGPRLVFHLTEPDYVEGLLNSSRTIQKSHFYKFSKPWLGQGLPVASGNQWRELRKLSTAGFHFKILEQFVKVFDKNAKILVDKLTSNCNSGMEFDIYPYIELCSLDNVCETAMGAPINAQQGKNLDYAEAVRSLLQIISERIIRPWIHPDFTFWLSSRGKRTKKYISVLHSFTYSVIRKRRQQHLSEYKFQDMSSKNEYGSKTLRTFLDTILQATANGIPLTDEQVREQVDSFLFAGSDSVSSALSHCVWNLAKYRDVQRKLLEEQKNIFGNTDRSATYEDLRNMVYLEMVIKESLRLYPAVFIFGRKLTEATRIGEHVFPAGSEIFVNPYFTHRNPDHFPEPEKFVPERFSPENCEGRHPYCYIPFSAGPRNCIGQKFAMYEMKATISRLLRNVEILESDSQKELHFVAELILKTTDGVRVKLRSRKTDI